ncbi:MAG: PAS domain-containing protein [Proteobacteria bacterium]|nr:PAS domain-containing protein [Pseudomonadota bacterium]
MALDWAVRCDDALIFDHAELTALCNLWLSKVQDGRLPSREQFDLRTLKTFVRNVSIIERVADEGPRYRFRLLGTDMVQVFGEVTGKLLDDVVPPERLDNWNAGYDAVLACGLPLRFVSHYRIPKVDYLTGESFTAPLRTDEGPPRTILAATFVKTKQSTTPPWQDKADGRT